MFSIHLRYKVLDIKKKHYLDSVSKLLTGSVEIFRLDNRSPYQQEALFFSHTVRVAEEHQREKMDCNVPYDAKST